MNKLLFVGIIVASLDKGSCYAREQISQDLFGKSILVTWEETRDQQNVGEDRIYNTKADSTLIIYIGTSGHIVSKTIFRYPSGHVSGSEVVQGEAPGGRTVILDGHSLTVFMPFGGGIRRIVVNLSGSFDSCTAKFTYAKRPGIKTPKMHDNVNNNDQYIYSVSFAQQQCVIRNGNSLD